MNAATLLAPTTASSPAEPAVQAAPSKWRARLRRLVRSAERLLAIAGLCLIVYLAGFDLTRIYSNSMSPTLQGRGTPDSDWILTEKFTYAWREPKRWELIAFNSTDGLKVMKRVVGRPGERVALSKEGVFRIDGAAVEKPASLAAITYYAHGRIGDGRVSDSGDGYFVMGDYSRDSQDSRWEDPVRRDAVIGRPWLIVWPPWRMGFLNP